MKWRTLKEVEADYIDQVIADVGSISAAARALGLGRRSLQRKLAKLGRRKPRPDSTPTAEAQAEAVELDHTVAIWLGSHIFWPVKDRINWRLQPWSHEMRDLIESYEREARDFAKQV